MELKIIEEGIIAGFSDKSTLAVGKVDHRHLKMIHLPKPVWLNG